MSIPVSDIIASVPVTFVGGNESAIAATVEYDSRSVQKGSLFIAIEGFASDGHDYIEMAIEKGASIIIVSEERREEFLFVIERGATLLYGKNTRKILSAISSLFYNHPSRGVVVIGVTGTNGKTSITYMLENIFKEAGYSVGVIGTVNYRWKNTIKEAPNTTPESKELQTILFEMKKDEVEIVILEVSSHSLYLHRVDNIQFNIAIFTNLTRDHMDLHKDFDDYYETKRRLFDLLALSGKQKKYAIINIDDSYGEKLYDYCQQYTFKTSSVSLHKGDYIPVGNSVQNHITGLSYIMQKPEKMNVTLQVVGMFQVYNSLCSIAAAYCLGLECDKIQNGINNLQTIPGRFDVLSSQNGFFAVIDYAHTSDALLKLLLSVNELDHNKIITVFGCGGDRDITKRPEMGSIAFEHSDMVIITSDNPRTEDPDKIIEDIITGINESIEDLDTLIIESDREKAISLAASIAEKGDIIVIAGKGHEDYQILGTEKIHFDDKEIVSKYI